MGAGCHFAVQYMAESKVKDMGWPLALSEKKVFVGTSSTATGQLLTLSKQQFWDCVTVGSACHGELMDDGGLHSP